MTDAREWRLFSFIEKSADRIGLRLTLCKYGEHRLALIPKDDGLPIYSRDAEIFTGDAEHLESALYGWNKAYEYFSGLGLLTVKKVADAESRVMQDKVVHMLRTGEKLEDAIK